MSTKVYPKSLLEDFIDEIKSMRIVQNFSHREKGQRLLRNVERGNEGFITLVNKIFGK